MGIQTAEDAMAIKRRGERLIMKYLMRTREGVVIPDGQKTAYNE